MVHAPLLITLVVAILAFPIFGSTITSYADQGSALVYSPNTPSELPICSSSQACPMGVADYGMSGNSTYAYTATTFLSWINFTSLNIGAREKMTIQQNLVAYNVTEKSGTGEYWIQNVPLITQLAGGNFRIKMIDNIWNFSAPGAMMSGSVRGNLDNQCSNKRDGHPVYYFCKASTKVVVTLPFEIRIVTSAISISGKSGFTFEIAIYQNGALVVDREYDRVSFAGRSSVSPVFLVGGKNPFGLYNDAETVLCGPGGGSSIAVLGIRASMSEGHSSVIGGSFSYVPHAYSAGADTAERVSGVSMSSLATGLAEASAGSDSFAELW